MKRTLVAAGIVLAGLFFLSPGHAEGLLYRLPDDGAFVKFEMEVTSNWPGEGKKTHKGTVTMASVGETQAEGKACRWLEIKIQAETPADHVVKVLIPSERLKLGESPLDHVVKGWIKIGENAAREITDFKSSKAGALPHLFPGPLTDAKKLPKKAIDSKLGKLECVGHVGKYSFDWNQDLTNEVAYETWVHDKAPFGVVAARLKVKGLKTSKEAGTWAMTLRLVEVGKGAKSDLPDNQ